MPKPKLKTRKESDGYIRKYYHTYNIYLYDKDELALFRQLQQYAKLCKLDLKSYLLKAGLVYGKKKNFLSTTSAKRAVKRK